MPAQSDETFTCLDGRSRVCARCCVEHCALDTPQWFAECSALGHPVWPANLRRRKLPAKLVALESYWDNRIFRQQSVKGPLEAFSALLNPPLSIAHRFVESERGLLHYSARPDGVLWTDARAWDAPVFYLAFHGAPGTMYSVLDTIGEEALCKAFEGYGNYASIVYFAACSVLKGRRGKAFARRFLQASGCRAVIGYATDVNWFDSMLVDLLFLKRFYSDADPWTNLRRIAVGLREDFALAKRLGWTCVRASR